METLHHVYIFSELQIILIKARSRKGIILDPKSKIFLSWIAKLSQFY